MNMTGSYWDLILSVWNELGIKSNWVCTVVNRCMYHIHLDISQGEYKELDDLNLNFRLVESHVLNKVLTVFCLCLILSFTVYSFTVNSGGAGHSCWNRLIRYRVLQLEMEQHSWESSMRKRFSVSQKKLLKVFHDVPIMIKVGDYKQCKECAGMSLLHHLGFVTNIFLSMQLYPRNHSD